MRVFFDTQILNPIPMLPPFVIPTSANCPTASAQKMALKSPAISVMWVPPVPTARMYLK